MRDRKFIIQASGTTKVVGLAGNFLKVKIASGEFDIRFEHAYLTIEEGYTIQSPVNWDQFELVNPSGVDVVVTLTVGMTKDFIVKADRLSGDVSIRQGATLQHAAPVAVSDVATLIAAAGTRKVLHIRNKGASTVYLGGAGVTVVNSAIELTAGAEWREEGAAAAAWYAITDTAGAASVAVMEGV